jgi:glycosyltransferase involved in cell wall biosynthesis
MPLSHLVLIPSYNTGARLAQTVAEARRAWQTVWVVIDGSTDGGLADMQCLAATDPGLRVLALPRNRGKGSAVRHGLRAAQDAGFTHALVMDADGQHDAGSIEAMMAASQARPEAMILGAPIFDASAPLVRVLGRRLSNFWVYVETWWAGIGDSLFGLRVYPIAPLLVVFETTRWMRRFDFDPEAAVRLAWRGVPAINHPTPVRYFRPEQGGVSHFNYLRDNLLLSFMHARLVGEAVLRGIRPSRR